MSLSFKTWLEDQTLGGGLEPPKQSPIDPSPGPGQSKGALADYHGPDSDELPPTPKKRTRRFNAEKRNNFSG
jgi:hypothetical protein